MTTCDIVRRSIDAYVDLELRPSDRKHVEDHIATCESCRKMLDSRRHLSLAVKCSAVYLPAPSNIGINLRRKTSAPLRRIAWIGSGFAFAACAAAFTVWKISASPTDKIVSTLVRDLGSNVSDSSWIHAPNAVVYKKYFKSQSLRFCPKLRGFGESDFKMVGVRLEPFEGQRLAAIVYRHNDQLVKLLVGPSDIAGLVAKDMNGIHIRAWNDCGLNYWAVTKSDALEIESLREELVGRQ